MNICPCGLKANIEMDVFVYLCVCVSEVRKLNLVAGDGIADDDDFYQ